MRGFGRILERYGGTADLHYGGGDAAVRARAIVQPVLERREDWRQALPTPLGLVRRDRFLYFGEPGAPLPEGRGGYVAYGGERYHVQSAQLVFVGAEASHWWAVLTPVDGQGGDHGGTG